jgi:cation:H+ antiporter
VSLIAFVGWTVRIGLQQNRRRAAEPVPDVLGLEFEKELPSKVSTPAALGWLAMGLVLLPASARVLVWGSVEIARALGVSDLVVGLTVVAIGTSLPEVATALASVLKKEDDIAIGNVLGSNLFNILGVLSVAGLIQPAPIGAVLLIRDIPAMLLLSGLLLSFALWAGHIRRGHGVFLLTAYAAYIAVLALTLHR